MEQQKFLDTVELIKNIAADNGNRITKKEITNILKQNDLNLDEGQLKMVYAYLKTSKIEVTDADYELVDIQDDLDTINSEEESKNLEDIDQEFVKIYQGDLKNLKTVDDESLLEAIKDYENKSELIINYFLKDVVRWAKKYKETSVLLTDLIQEGNMGLMEGVAAFDYKNALLCEDPVKKIKEYMKKCVNEAIMNILYAEEGEKNVGYKIAGRVNAVNDCAKKLAEDYNRPVTIEELAVEMDMSYEEIKEIVELSSNKIEYIKE